MNSPAQETPKASQHNQPKPVVQAEKKATDSTSKEQGAPQKQSPSAAHESHSAHVQTGKMSEPKEYQYKEKEESSDIASHKNT
jgi:hypothetical protein